MCVGSSPGNVLDISCTNRLWQAALHSLLVVPLPISAMHMKGSIGFSIRQPIAWRQSSQEEYHACGCVALPAPVLHPVENFPESPWRVLQPVTLRRIPDRRPICISLTLLIVPSTLHGLSSKLVCHQPAHVVTFWQLLHAFIASFLSWQAIPLPHHHSSATWHMEDRSALLSLLT